MKKMLRDVVVGVMLFVLVVSFVSVDARNKKLAGSNENPQVVDEIETVNNELVINE